MDVGQTLSLAREWNSQMIIFFPPLWVEMETDSVLGRARSERTRPWLGPPTLAVSWIGQPSNAETSGHDS